MDRSQIDPVQRDFASVLTWIVRIGLIVMLVTFGLYVSGIVDSSAPVDTIADHWELSASEYRTVTESEEGWRWITQIGDGATLAFAALAFFPLAIIVAMIIAAVLYAKHRLTAHAVIAAALALVLTVAATGLLSIGQ